MPSRESGSAMLLALMAILILSFLGFFIAINANTGVKISDNFETQIQATYAALAGLNHARALVRGLAFDELLEGPDGIHSGDAAYAAEARQFSFRNLLPLQAFYPLDISNPLTLLRADDGLISTGSYGGAAGIPLIPAAGIGFTSDNPYGPGRFVTSRYFVKVTDNSGDASEIAGDPADDPFKDGDGIVIVRSAGISKTFAEAAGAASRLNSVALFEARFKRTSAFDAGPAIVLLGSDINASFGGPYEISGGLSPGIGSIDTDLSDANLPDQILSAAAGPGGLITGGGRAIPSIQDITLEIFAGGEKGRLMDPRFLREFVTARAPKFADLYMAGDQNWAGAGPYAGTYDFLKPWNAPGQDPRVTVVNGNLNISGSFTGGGILVVSGSLSCTGIFAFSGLVIAAGSGSFRADFSGQGIQGGLILANLQELSGSLYFGVPTLSVHGNSRVQANRDAIRMAISLIPVSQISFREINTD